MSGNPYGFDGPDDEEACEDCGHVGPVDGIHTCGDDDDH
jgi:hypothetical protein